MTIHRGPELVVEPSALFPPLSGVGYYTRELLRTYETLPGHFPVRILGSRWYFKPWQGPADIHLRRVSEATGYSVDLQAKLTPSAIDARLRLRNLRLPLPVDLFTEPGSRVFFYPNYVGPPLGQSPSVPVIYDFSYLRYPHILKAKSVDYLRRYLPATIRQATRIVVISESIKAELMRYFGVAADRIAVVYPAIDLTVFRPDIPWSVRELVRRKHGLTGDYIFSLSTVEPRKNFPRLIQAYALLPESVRAVYPLVVAGGKGWKNEDVFATIRRLGLEGQIQFLGYIDEEDRAPLMSEAALFVLPSLYEGFGMPVLEAMACGTPVVTSSRGALAEVGGEAVVDVDPHEPEDIARGMLSVLKSAELERKLVQAGPVRAQSFTWESSARVLAETFAQAAAEGGPKKSVCVRFAQAIFPSRSKP
jgi:glycosyltransferase involved in cell wall biosynthesis